MLTALFHLFSGSLDGLGRAEARALAIELAEAHLAALGISEPLGIGTTRGRFDDRFAWEQVVEPVAGSDRLRHVQFAVSWQQAGGGSFALETLRLAPPAQARP